MAVDGGLSLLIVEAELIISVIKGQGVAGTEHRVVATVMK